MMDFYREHLLSIITFPPLLGAFVLLLVPKGNDNAVRWIANAFGLIGFLVSLPLWYYFPGFAFQLHPQIDARAPGFQLIEQVSWILSSGVSYFLGVDGVSALLILLTTLPRSIGLLCCWTA